ncbi:MAG: hypothetical protein DSY90_12070 [Deltaproteobacteria bacterium]|nr:MAG: hypothetical protein DSY90_12070 [Deltaproteobacteria bacterium]
MSAGGSSLFRHPNCFIIPCIIVDAEYGLGHHGIDRFFVSILPFCLSEMIFHIDKCYYFLIFN